MLAVITVDDARGRIVMDACTVVSSAGWRKATRPLAAGLFVVICIAAQNVLAADGGRRTHPSQYGDPRCESRRSGPRLERDELRCDNRAQPRRVDHSDSPSSPLSPLLEGPSAGHTPANSNSHQQSRPVERDVGFDDALATPGNPGAAGTNPGAAGPAIDNRRPRRW
jgi:hypothetical protein